MPEPQKTNRQTMPLATLQRIQAEKRGEVPVTPPPPGIPRRKPEYKAIPESQVKGIRDQLALLERKIKKSDVENWQHSDKTYSKKDILRIIQDYKGTIRNSLAQYAGIQKHLEDISKIKTQWGSYKAYVEDGQIVLVPPPGMPLVNQTYFETQYAPPGTTFMDSTGKSITKKEAMNLARANKDFYWLTEGIKIYAKENPLSYWSVNKLYQYTMSFFQEGTPEALVNDIMFGLGLKSEKDWAEYQARLLTTTAAAIKGGPTTFFPAVAPGLAVTAGMAVAGVGVGALSVAATTSKVARVILKGVKIGGATYAVASTGVALAPDIKTGLETGEWGPTVEELLRTGLMIIPAYYSYKAGYRTGKTWAARRMGATISVNQIGAIKVDNIRNMSYRGKELPHIKQFNYEQRIIQTETIRPGKTIEKTYLIKGKGYYVHKDTHFISKKASFMLERGKTYAWPEKAFEIIGNKQKSISLQSLGFLDKPVELKISVAKKGLEFKYRPSVVTGKVKGVSYKVKGLKPTVEIKAGPKIYKEPVFKGPPGVKYRPFAVVTKVGKKFIKTKGVIETSKLKPILKAEGKTWELYEQRGLAKTEFKTLKQKFLVAVEKQQETGYKPETYKLTVDTKARFGYIMPKPVAKRVLPIQPKYEIKVTGKPTVGFEPEVPVGIISPKARVIMLPPTTQQRLGYKLKPQTDVILKSKLELRVPVVSDLTAMLEKQAEKVKLAQETMIQQVQEQKQIVDLFIAPFTILKEATPIPPIVGVPYIPSQRKKPVKEFIEKQGYNVYAKKHATKPKRKWVQLNKQPLKEKQALGLGAKAVDASVARTFKIKKTKKQVVSKPHLDNIWYQKKHKFRKPIKKGKVQHESPLWIEKSKHLIDSPEEFKGITVEGWKAKQAKKQQKMFMYTGPPRSKK